MPTDPSAEQTVAGLTSAGSPAARYALDQLVASPAERDILRRFMTSRSKFSAAPPVIDG